MKWEEKVCEVATEREVTLATGGALTLTLEAGQIYWRDYPMPVWSRPMGGGCYEDALSWVKSQAGWAQFNKRAAAQWRAAPAELAVAYGHERTCLRRMSDREGVIAAAGEATRAVKAVLALPDAILADVARAVAVALEGHLDTPFNRGWPEVVVARGELIALLEFEGG